MVEIHLSNPDYCYASNITSSIRSVLENHPLGTNILTSKVLDILKIKVAFGEPSIECNQYPNIILHLNPYSYQMEGHFNETLCKQHLYHEFTHLIDRLNPEFQLGLTNNPQDNEVRIWNVYIDGRLWKENIKVKSFEDYETLLFGRRLQRGYRCSEAIRKCKIVWEAKSLTYNDIASLTIEITRLSVKGV